MLGKTFGKFNFFRKHLITKIVLEIKNVYGNIPLLLPVMMNLSIPFMYLSHKKKSNQVTDARQKLKIKLSSGSRRLCEIEQNRDVKSKIFHRYFEQYTITAVLLGTVFL